MSRLKNESAFGSRDANTSLAIPIGANSKVNVSRSKAYLTFKQELPLIWLTHTKMAYQM